MLETLSPRYRTKARYSEDGQYDGEEIVSFDPAGLTGPELDNLRAEIDKALAPLSRDEIIQEISLLRTVTRSRAEQGSDLKAMLLVYAADLSDVPGMALKRAILEIRQTSTWFPTVAEIRQKAEAKCQRARVAKAALTAPTPAGKVIAQVRSMTHATDRMARMLEQSQHWPDPQVKKTMTLKPLHVHNPATAHFGKTVPEKEGV